MSTLITMPEVLAGVTEAAIVAWTKQPGDEVAAGDTVAEIETEKAVVDYQVESGGVIAQILVQPGETVSVGTPILLLAEEGEDAASLSAPSTPAAEPAEQSAAEPAAAAEQQEAAVVEPVAEQATVDPAPAATAASAPPAAPGARLFASPLARRLAGERGIDLGAVQGTGPGGRVTRRDIEAFTPSAAATVSTTPASAGATAPAAAGALPEGAIELPVTRMRRTIARRLTESKTQVPHFYLDVECRVDRLLALRAELNESIAASYRGEGDAPRLSVNDLVVKAAAAALRDVPEAHLIWHDAGLLTFDRVDIAVAVSIEGGLVTPVVRGVDRLGLLELHAEGASLAERARGGGLAPDDLVGGTLAVSNLGMYGTRRFSAILNPPQSIIIAVGAATQQPVVENGALAVGTVMSCTLSVDHRAIDGSVAAQFAAAFQRRIESPLGLLV